MSTTATLRPVAQTAATADDDPAARLAAYRARVDILRAATDAARAATGSPPTA